MKVRYFYCLADRKSLHDQSKDEKGKYLNEVFKVVEERRSIRKYKDKPVSDEDLKR